MSTSETDARLIQRILRVNHAGEHGAISIYSAQINRAGNGSPTTLLWLKDTRAHEVKHRHEFREAMPPRDAKPCRALFVWKYGGAALGWITALFGETGIMVCTAAVERTVHRHLEEQITFLEPRDTGLAELIKTIQKDELEHLDYAEQHHNPNSILAKTLQVAVAAATELLIAISTRGDSVLLAGRLRQSNPH